MEHTDAMNDIDVARLVGISQVTVRGRGGKPASVKAIRDYIRTGCRPQGYDGEPVYLKAVRMGQEYCTLPEWVEEFERARARAGLVAARPSPKPAPARKALAEHRRAEREWAEWRRGKRRQG
ncbi:MAG: hypothetical protein U0797_12920 [Gemmataceae bacterium]